MSLDLTSLKAKVSTFVAKPTTYLTVVIVGVVAFVAGLIL